MREFLLILFSGTGFAAICSVGYLFYKSGQYQNIIDEMKITLVIHSNKFDSINNRFDTISSKLEEITNRLCKLEVGIERDRYYNELIVKESPFRITEKGYNALKESGAQKFIDNNRSILIEKVENMNPKSSYDVQEYSKLVISQYTDSDDFIEIKEYIYEKGFDLESMVMTMMVYLRDIILFKRRTEK